MTSQHQQVASMRTREIFFVSFRFSEVKQACDECRRETNFVLSGRLHTLHGFNNSHLQSFSKFSLCPNVQQNNF